MPTKTVYLSTATNKPLEDETEHNIRNTNINKIIPIKLYWKCPHCNYTNYEVRFSGDPGKILSHCGHCGKPVTLTH